MENSFEVQVWRPIFQDRHGREHIGEPVPMGLLEPDRAAQDRSLWGMRLIGLTQ